MGMEGAAAALGFGPAEESEQVEDPIEVEENEEESSTETEDPILEEDDDESDDPFSEDEDGDDSGKEGTEGSDEDSEPKSKPKVQKRIDRLVAERQEAREEALRLNGRVESLEDELDTYKEANVEFARLYGRFDDPVAQLRFDAAFLNEIEEASKVDTSLANALRPILAKVEKNPMTQDAREDHSPATKESSTPAGDAVLTKIIQRDATKTIEASLPEGVRPAFANMLKKEIFAALAPEDLAALDKDAVLHAAREFAKANGFDRDDIYASAPTKAPSKPPTGGKASGERAVKVREKASKEAAGSDDGKPKNVQEWRSRNIQRMEKALGL